MTIYSTQKTVVKCDNCENEEVGEWNPDQQNVSIEEDLFFQELQKNGWTHPEHLHLCPQCNQDYELYVEEKEEMGGQPLPIPEWIDFNKTAGE